MKTSIKSPHSPALIRSLLPAAFFGVLGSSASAAVSFATTGVYDENAVATNTVDKSASATTNNAASFTAAVATAFASGTGGVVGFDRRSNGTVINNNTGDTNLSAVYSLGTKSLAITTSNGNVSANPGSFQAISGATGLSDTSTTVTQRNAYQFGGGSLNLTLGDITSVSTGLTTGEFVSQTGFTLLSRISSFTSSGATAVVVATFQNLTAPTTSTQTLTSTILQNSAGDDTFFGFTAPSGSRIASISISLNDPTTGSLLTGASTGIDDFGFIAGSATTIPEPSSVLLIGIAGGALLARRRRDRA